MSRCHRPVSRAVASLAVFSSACRSAKVSPDILKLTSCSECVGLALNAGGPAASRVGPTPCPTLDNPPKAGGKRACAASRFCSVTPSLSSTVCAPTWLASSCTCHGLARLLTGDSANRGQADRARRHLPRQGGEARQLEGAGGKVLLQRRPALAQRMRQRLGVLARQPELLQLEGQRVNRHVVPSRRTQDKVQRGDDSLDVGRF